MSFFINDVLGQASSGSGRYTNISTEIQANAAIMHKELQKIEELYKKTSGAKVIISGSAVGIDLKNGKMRVSKW
ncbi:hypothetical protein [Acinetobacter vivianii]|uniref:hypothetical protein n=1 Tax=Acinetobacter vivianii TaxID=1776742 RepID=UPI002DBFA463|nr:hypothetical protein [Acinetobacter vivianii]MEB6479400.1 hypothetical protein [Acinetobacter vivianii]MEB6656769.1 hypothetical protein [Acinetobacter vivianii]